MRVTLAWSSGGAVVSARRPQLRVGRAGAPIAAQGEAAEGDRINRVTRGVGAVLGERRAEVAATRVLVIGREQAYERIGISRIDQV